MFHAHEGDLIGPDDRKLTQKVGVDLVAGRRLRRIRTSVYRLNRHALHQGANVQTPNLVSFDKQQDTFRLAAALEAPSFFSMSLWVVYNSLFIAYGRTKTLLTEIFGSSVLNHSNALISFSFNFS